MQRDDAKEKSDAAGAAPDQEGPEGVRPHARITSGVQYHKPARSPLARAVDLATTLAEDAGWYGTYTAHDGDIYWRNGRHSETVAATVNGMLVLAPGADVDHEPFVLAADLVSGIELVRPEGVGRE